MLKEDYEEAGRLKVAIAAASTVDTVGRVMSCLKVGTWTSLNHLLIPLFCSTNILLSLVFCFEFQSAINEERYQDAAFMRDNAGTGLVGVFGTCFCLF